MSRLRWKVCGITSANDAALAVAAGADALGFVLWPHSKRAVDAETAMRIAAGLPPAVSAVGVFVNASGGEIAAAVERVGLDVVQLAGDEPAGLVAELPCPVWKALRLAPGTSADAAATLADQYARCTLLIDASVPGTYGGSGETADWELAASLAATRKVVLAGGLEPGNVGRAVRRVKPWGVDVASGVEAAPGKKDDDKLRRFAAALEAYR